METIDELDAKILLALDDNSDATVLALARELGVARNTIQARLRRLANHGALRSFSQRVDPTALGYRLVAFVALTVDQATGQLAAQRLADIPEVIEIHATTGDADLLIKLLARDPGDLHRVVNAVLQVEGVQRSSTTVSLVEHMPTRLRALLQVAAGTMVRAAGRSR